MSENTGEMTAAPPAETTPSASEQVAPADIGTTAPVTEQPPAAEGDTSGSETARNIPYDRFNQVVQERNKLREEHQAFQNQFSQYQQQVEQRFQQVQQVDPLEAIRKALTPQQQEQVYVDPLEKELAETREQMQQLQQWREQQELQAQQAKYAAFYDDAIDKAIQAHPYANREAVRFALIQNPNPQVALDTAAKAAKASADERAAFARGFKQVTPPPAGLVPNSAAGFEFEKPPESFKEAADRLRWSLENA